MTDPHEIEGTPERAAAHEDNRITDHDAEQQMQAMLADVST